MQVLGVFYLGDDLTVTYVYDGTNPEDGTTFEWYQATDMEGAGAVLIDDATARTYAPIAGDVDKFIACKVTPSDGTDTGTPVLSAYRGPVTEQGLFSADLLYNIADASTIFQDEAGTVPISGTDQQNFKCWKEVQAETKNLTTSGVSLYLLTDDVLIEPPYPGQLQASATLGYTSGTPESHGALFAVFTFRLHNAVGAYVPLFSLYGALDVYIKADKIKITLNGTDYEFDTPRAVARYNLVALAVQFNGNAPEDSRLTVALNSVPSSTVVTVTDTEITGDSGNIQLTSDAGVSLAADAYGLGIFFRIPSAQEAINIARQSLQLVGGYAASATLLQATLLGTEFAPVDGIAAFYNDDAVAIWNNKTGDVLSLSPIAGGIITNIRIYYGDPLFAPSALPVTFYVKLNGNYYAVEVGDTGGTFIVTLGGHADMYYIDLPIDNEPSGEMIFGYTGTVAYAYVSELRFDYAVANLETFALGVEVPQVPGSTAYMDAHVIWCEDVEFKVEALLQSVVLQTAISGTGDILILSPEDGGYSINKIAVSYGIGNITLEAGTDFPAGLYVPKDGLIGFMSNTASAVYADIFHTALRYRMWQPYPVDDFLPSYSYPSGSPTNSKVFRPSSNFQVHYNLVRDMSAFIPETSINSDDFSLVDGPVVMWGSKWTKGSGSMTSSTTGGLPDLLQMAFGPTFNRNITFSAEFEFSAAASSLYVFRQTEFGGQGSLFSINLADNTVILYDSLNATDSSPPSVYDSITCSFSFVEDRVYLVELIKDNYTHTLRITDTETEETDELSYDGYTNGSVAGLCYGTPAVACAAGVITLRSIDVSTTIPAPKAVLLGDSITEGSGAPPTNGWAYLVQQAVAATVSARGGDTSNAVVYRVAIELEMFPCLRYAIIDIGTNDTNMTTWQNNIDLMASTCRTYGVEPVFCTMLNNDNTRPQVTQNPYIRNNFRFIDMAVALSVGGDGTTWDASLFTDDLHPNTAGYLAMYNQVLLDLPELFE